MFPTSACTDGAEPAAAAAALHPASARFEDVVHAYGRSLTQAAYRITQNVEDAHDATQHAFMQLYCRWPRFADRRAVERWLYVVARNAALNISRTREREAAVASSASNMQSELGIEETILREELGAAVRATIALLPPAQRSVIEMRHLDAMLASEIACELGLPLKRVKADVDRARLRLRVEMERRGLDADVR